MRDVLRRSRAEQLARFSSPLEPPAGIPTKPLPKSWFHNSGTFIGSSDFPSFFFCGPSAFLSETGHSSECRALPDIEHFFF
jgi:hypothetical protein